MVNEDKIGGDYPSIACTKDACFLVWHEVDKGADAVLIDPVRGTVLWRKRFAPKGGHPAVAYAEDGPAEVAFYEAGRVRVAGDLARRRRDDEHLREGDGGRAAALDRARPHPRRVARVLAGRRSGAHGSVRGSAAMPELTAGSRATLSEALWVSADSPSPWPRSRSFFRRACTRPSSD